MECKHEINCEVIEDMPLNTEIDNIVSGGTKDHDKLINRDLPDQHPISAITGLQDELDSKAEASETYTKDEIDEALIGKADKEDTYTKYDVDDLLSEKQNVIDDLNTIRSNAEEGKSASDTIATYGDIVTHDTDEFATASQGAKADTALQPTDIIDNVTSTATNKALSANQGKELSARITNLESLGRYLSEWNCVTGLAMTDPTYSPYPYRTGDYFLVLNIAGAGGTNYRPAGTEYVIGQASTVVETGNVTVGSKYIYDGTVWILQSNGEQTVSFSNIAGQPTDNANLASALNSKIEDVKVNGTSVVTNKVANVTVPTKTSDLTNDSNYVTNTNYASSGTAGVIKVSNTYGFNISSNNGILTALPRTYEQYLSLLQNACISKGTLESVIEGKELQTASDVITALATKQDKFSTFAEIDGNEINVEELETGAYICKEDCTLLNNLGASIQVEAGTIFVKNDGGIGLIYGYGLCWGDFSLSDWNDIYAPTFIDLYNMPLTRGYSELNTANKEIISAINELQSTKQELLVSGTNIKTINGNSVLGRGNITIESGGNVDDVKVNGTSVVDSNKVAQISKSAEGTLGVVSTNSWDYGTSVSDSGELTSVSKSFSDYYSMDNKGFVSKGTLENFIIGKQIVKATDYATTAKAGTIKLGNGLNASSGAPSCDVRTYAQYGTDSNYMFISKGTLENVLNGKAYVKNTDYATSSVGGVVRTTTTYCSGLTSSGQLRSEPRTYTQYQTLHDNAFISRGTLENVITGKQLQTASDVATAVSTKQDIISDLSDIRSGAEAGSTALQSSDVVNNVISTTTDKPLSANMGKELSDRISNIANIGRYLANWNATTGLPTTNPSTELPYAYTTGMYYVVSSVGATNYKPSGSSYTGTASTTVETGNLAVGDFYIYDGTNWSVLKNTGVTTTFSNIGGQPSDNSNLASALNGKENASNKVTSINSSSTNTQYPSAKAVFDNFIPKQFGNQVISTNKGTKVPMAQYGASGYNGILSNVNVETLANNYFYKCYERRPNCTVTCNFDNVVTDLGKKMFDGSISGYYTQINPSTDFTTENPFILEMKSTSNFEATDVAKLLILGHRLTNPLYCTKYKLEVAYAYSNSQFSWTTIIDYEGAGVNICGNYYGLFDSNVAQGYHSIYGIRLTIYGSTTTVFSIAEIQLICTRGTENPVDSIHALSDSGGKIWGNLEVTNNITANGNLEVKGVINTANNTLNKIGDDVYIGDVDMAGCLGIKGRNGATGIIFKPYSGSTDIKMTSDGSGTLTVTGTISSTFNGNLTGTATKAAQDANGNVITTTYATKTELNSKENTSNKVTTINSLSTDTQYPTAKCVYDIVGNIEATLQAIRGV